MKTETAEYAAERGKRATAPTYIARFFHVPTYGASTDYAFAVDFSTRAVLASTKTKLLYIEHVEMQGTSVLPEQGRSLPGNAKIHMADISGEVLKYLSQPALTLEVAMTAGSPGPGGFVEVNENTAGMPAEGTLEISTGGIVERVRYDLNDQVNKRFRVVSREAHGTTAVSHGIGDPVTNGEVIRPGQRVQILCGYDVVNEDKFMSWAKMEVVSRPASRAGFSIECQDIQRTLRRRIFLGASEDAPVLLEGNPLTILLQVLTSTGIQQANSAHDLLAAVSGVGMPQGLLDITGIENLRDAEFSTSIFRFKITGEVEAKAWIEEQILKPNNCYPWILQDGRYTIRRYKPAPSPGSVTETLTDQDIVDHAWEPGDRQIINRVVWQYDWDLPTAPGDFGIRQEFRADVPPPSGGQSSIAKYGPRQPLIFSAQGLRKADGIETTLQDRAFQVFKRFGDPPPTLRCTVFYRKHTWEVGDPIKVTHPRIPNRKTGLRGITDEVFEIVEMQPMFGRQGKLLLTLLHTGSVPTQSAPTAGGETVTARRGAATAPPRPGGLELVGLGLAGEFVGRDVKLRWNAVSHLPTSGNDEDNLASQVNTIRDYTVRVVVGGVTIREYAVAAPEFTYPWERNVEDHGFPGLRTLTFEIRARSVAGLLSLPASITVTNPAPEMVQILPVITALIDALLIDWSAYASIDTDLTHYEIYVDTVNPPVTKFGVRPHDQKNIIVPNLLAGTTYYVQLKPFDAFGQGAASQVASAVPKALSGSGFGMFLRAFTPQGIEFSFDEATHTIAWTAGTLHYVDDALATQSRAIEAGSAIWTAGTLFIVYTLGGTTFLATTDLTQALGPNKAVMAVYLGFRQMIVNWGKVIQHGSDILANTIGANQLIANSAVITNALQVANAIINNGHITSCSIDKLTAGTITVDGTFGASNGRLITAASGKRVELSRVGLETYDPSNRRVILGEINAAGDYGMKVSKAGFDAKTAADANLIFSTAYNLFKIQSTGTTNVTFPLVNADTQALNILDLTTHNLGFVPAYLAYIEGGFTGGREGLNGIQWRNGRLIKHQGGSGGPTTVTGITATNNRWATASSTKLQVANYIYDPDAAHGAESRNIRWYVMLETGE